MLLLGPGLGQLLVANGLEFGTGKDEKLARERLIRERKLMAENAKKARAAAGERVIFEVIDGPRGPTKAQKALAAPARVKTEKEKSMEMDKQARLKKEMSECCLNSHFFGNFLTTGGPCSLPMGTRR